MKIWQIQKYSTDMSKKSFLKLNHDLCDSKLTILLTSLAFNLTIVARNTYVVDSDSIANPKGLRGINEICHKVLSRALSVWAGAWRHTPEAFCDLIFEMANTYGCFNELEAAIAFATENWEQSEIDHD